MIRARSLASLTAISTGPLLFPPADRNTWSAPRPLVILREFGQGAVQLVRRPAGDRAALLGQTAAVGDRIDADRPHAGRREQPDHDLPDQSEADDGRGLAKLNLGSAHPVHGDRCHGRERRVLGQHPGRNGRAQVDRHPVVLGVQCLLITRARNELADLELLGARAHLGDHTAQRIAKRGVGVELVHHLLVGGGQPLLLHLVENLLAPGRAWPAPCRPSTCWPRRPSSSRCPSISARTASGPGRRPGGKSGRARRGPRVLPTCSSGLSASSACALPLG